MSIPKLMDVKQGFKKFSSRPKRFLTFDLVTSKMKELSTLQERPVRFDVCH
jgi:hypothetical protein